MKKHTHKRTGFIYFFALIPLAYITLARGAAPYSQFIIQAALHQQDKNPHALVVLHGAHVRMMTFTKNIHYQISDKRLKNTIWTTAEPEFKKTCANYIKKNKNLSHHALLLWAAQMLGMPPDELDQFKIVVFDVPLIQAYYGAVPKNIGIFRPCTDPRIGKHLDGSVACPNIMDMQDPNIASTYKTWFINNAIASYTLKKEKLSGHTHFIGFPWTRYGYTYNWNAKARSIYGLSEFVILKNTPVAVLANPHHPKTAYLNLEEYCGK